MTGTDQPLALAPALVDRVSALCLALPEVTVRIDESRAAWRSRAWCFDVRRRSFCLLVAVRRTDGSAAPRLVLRVHPEDRVALVASGDPFFVPRPGERHRDRLGVALTAATDWDEVGILLVESYRLLAPKKLTALLG